MAVEANTLTEKELSKLVREIVDEIFETNWCYEDIIEELEKRGLLRGLMLISARFMSRFLIFD